MKFDHCYISDIILGMAMKVSSSGQLIPIMDQKWDKMIDRSVHILRIRSFRFGRQVQQYCFLLEATLIPIWMEAAICVSK